MGKLFRDLKVGDPVYWVYYRNIYLVNVLVEKYKILDIKHRKDGDLECKLTHDWYLVVKPYDAVKDKTDSFFVTDEGGIEWAVNKLKKKKMEEYQKQITAITEKMCEVMKSPYQLYDKT